MLHKNILQERFQQLELFEQIYHLTKARKIDELKDQLKKVDFEDINYKVLCLHDPFTILAQEGDEESLKFLQTIMTTLPVYVIKGHAMAGRHDIVNKMIDNENNTSHKKSLATIAGQAYSFIGDWDRAKEMIKKSADYFDTFAALALGGHNELIDQISHSIKNDKNVSNEDRAIGLAFCYALGGSAPDAEKQLKIANRIIENKRAEYPPFRSVDIDMEIIESTVAITRAFLVGGYLDNEYVFLHVLPFINDLNIRKSIATKAADVNPDFNVDHLMKKSAMMNKLLNKNNFTFQEALHWSDQWHRPELHILFLQGIHLVSNGRLVFDMFIHIASFVVELPNDETRKLLYKHNETLPKKLYEHSLKSLTLFNPRDPQSSKEHQTKLLNAAMERYDNRVNFIQLK